MKKNKVSHYIGGEWVTGHGETFFSLNPATGTRIWQGKYAGEEEIQRAYFAANNAFTPWALLDFSKRASYLQAFAQQVATQHDRLVYLISLETGKPSWEARTEVASVLSKIDLSIKSYQERMSEKQFITAEATAYLRYKPHGVVAVLGAFNFPAHLSNGHIVPALLAGNTVIYKPSELTPAVAQCIMQCWQAAGLPPGVINCIQGNVSSSQALLSLPIQGVYFTGSYATGKLIHQTFSARPEIILALEMGGNNPLIIDELQHHEAAIYYTLLSAFITAGQRCTCARRLFIPSSKTGDRFLAKLIQATQNLTIGHFNAQPEPFMGPVIRPDHAKHHLQRQEELIRLGGKPLLKMVQLQEDTGFLSPGIIDMTTCPNPPDEEIFAPFIQLYRYHDFEEALALANQTKYGLVAGLLSEKKSNYQKFYQTIKTGLIHWNKPTTGAMGNLPFGGIGYSGNHRPSGYFATDYCAYPIANIEQPSLVFPATPLPGIII